MRELSPCEPLTRIQVRVPIGIGCSRSSGKLAMCALSLWVSGSDADMHVQLLVNHRHCTSRVGVVQEPSTFGKYSFSVMC